MGASTKEIGGGGATGLANDFTSALQSLLNTGGMGTAGSPNPFGSTSGIMGLLSDLLQPGGGKAGGAIQERLGKQQERDVNGLRARFTQGGGQAFGTPAQYAESNYRAEVAPNITTAISGLQMQALGPLLQAITQLSGKGISQRQTVESPGLAGQILGPIASIAKSASSFAHPSFGAGTSGGSVGENFSKPATFGQSFDLGSADLDSLQGFFQ